MKILLRSCFTARPEDEDHLALENHFAMMDASLGFEQVEDTALWTYITDFVRQHHHVPAYTTLREHFTRQSEMEVVDRLEALTVLAPRFRGDFLQRLNERAEDRRIRVMKEILTEAGRIVKDGITVKEGKEEKILKGPYHAIQYVMQRSHDIVTPTTGQRLYGNVPKDGQDFLNRYQRVKEDPKAGIGFFTGLTQMDEALKGAKRAELWTHAAFTGGLKSTLALNWAYNQAIFYGNGVMFVSLEMPYEQCRNILYAMHSGHHKFAKVFPPLPYEGIRDGTLTPDQEAFLRNFVVPDFGGEYVVSDPDRPEYNGRHPGYGDLHIEVSDPDKSDYTVADMKSRAELLYQQTPFQTIFVDHAGLMAPRKWVSSTTERLNQVLRDLKRMSMNFRRGMGIAVVSLFQISREGFKAAEKLRKASGSNHVYNLTHLSYANEAERSSDIVTASFVDEELEKASEVLYQCLKARDHKKFEPFKAKVVWGQRRILTLENQDIENVREIGEALDANILDGIGV